MRLQHEYVAHIRDGREVGDNAREADLSGIPIINPKAQRMLDRPRHHFPWNAFCPIAIGQKIVNEIQIQPIAIGADQKLAKPIFLNYGEVAIRNSRHLHILNRRRAASVPAADC